MTGIFARVGDQDGAADDESEADCEGALPAGLDLIREDGIEYCGDNSGPVEAGGVIVLLNRGVAPGGHPQLEDIVKFHLNCQGVNCKIRY